MADDPIQSRHAHLGGVQSLKDHEGERIVKGCALCVTERNATGRSLERAE